ncbi:MAG: MBL fold metallo-hydrolase [Verrucomicrobiales bacterium]|nr:MBL fold metallo-hydrolase [Verrucomicrobiales bacterium]
MSLEDHVGDVIAKARLHAGVDAAEAAAAAGIAAPAMEAFEDSGKVDGPINWTGLAGRLGLDAGKLERLAGGWQPGPVDLAAWRELRVITTRGAHFSVNAYLVWDEVTREGALFDTGFEAAPALEIIEREAVDLRHLFITHSHADHVAGLAAIRARHPKARLHSSMADAALHERNRANDFIHLGSLRITNRSTPGHAVDGVTYVVGTWPEDAPPVAIVGDAIFAGSMGRAAGAAEEARKAIREQILALPPETLICPGHGPLTTVAEEKANNPFF